MEKDSVTFSSFEGSRPHLDQRADRSMINMDDPEHQAQRNLVARRFTPRSVRDHEARVRGIVTEILDEVTPVGECEAIEAIASRLPAIVVGVSPVLNMRRTATVDTELHGRRIHAGDEVLLLYPAANRDPRAFADPDVLDVTRQHNRHVAFGFGSHFCLGAHLARLELRVVFEELLRRLPDWELVDPDEPRILPATFTRAYDRVRIRFTPSR